MIFGRACRLCRLCLRFARETVSSAPIGLATLLVLLLVCNPNILHSRQAVACSTGGVSAITLDLIVVNSSWESLPEYCP